MSLASANLLAQHGGESWRVGLELVDAPIAGNCFI